jgi:hypothetical protein
VRYGVRGTGVALRQRPDGTLAAVDAAGTTVASSGAALMWDAAGDGVEPPDDARQAQAGVRLDGDRLEITPDERLLGDPGTRYPVLIDPAFATGASRWAYADSTNANRNDGIARVGLNTDGSGTFRSFFEFPMGGLAGKHVLNAVFATKLVHSWSCAATPVSLYWTGAIASTPRTAWSPGLSQHLQERSANAHKGSADCGNQPDVHMEFGGGLTGLIQTGANQGWGAVTLGLSARRADGSGESTQSYWKKFSPAGTDTYLAVDYNSYPAQPTNLTTDPSVPCVTGAGRPVINTATPALAALVNDADAGQFLNVDVRLVKLGQGEIRSLAAGNLPVNSVARVTVPAGVFADGDYGWFLRSGDGIDVSPWSAACELTVDTTRPAAVPGVTSSVYPEDLVSFHGGVGLTAPFTFDAGGVADVAGYDWSFASLPVTATGAPMVAAPSVGAAVTVPLTPPPPVPQDPTAGGQTVLHVRSVDRAGNRGPIRDYSFLVGSAAPEAGHWALDDGGGTTAADASGNGHPATAGGGVSWTPGRLGGAATFDGTTAALTTAVPVAQTDASFSVAAWVRLGSLGAGNVTAVAQDGATISGFYLGTHDRAAGGKTWRFGLPGADATGGPWAIADSPAALGAGDVGRWVHLVGVYDAATRRAVLYLDGRWAGTSGDRPPSWSATGPLTIGRARWEGGPADRWPGDIDDVRVWNRVVSAAEVPALVRESAPAGWWPLDDGAGPTAADAAGTGRPATLVGGAAWSAGSNPGDPTDRAVTLDGTSGHLRTAGPAVATGASFTVAARVRLASLPAGSATAVAQDGVVLSGFYLGARQIGTAGRHWSFSLLGADTPASPWAHAAVPLPDSAVGRWVHLAGVYDAAAQQVRLYVDGRLVATAARPTAWTAAGPLTIGAAWWTAPGLPAGRSDWWPGDIDDVGAWAGVLADSQILDLALR